MGTSLGRVAARRVLEIDGGSSSSVRVGATARWEISYAYDWLGQASLGSVVGSCTSGGLELFGSVVETLTPATSLEREGTL